MVFQGQVLNNIGAYDPTTLSINIIRVSASL